MAHAGLFKGHFSCCIRKNLYRVKIKVNFSNIMKKLVKYNEKVSKKYLTINMINVIIFIVSKCGCGGTGRRAGLRNQCQRRGGSSPFIRTKTSFCRTLYNA